MRIGDGPSFSSMRIGDGPRCASVSLSATVHQNRDGPYQPCGPDGHRSAADTDRRLVLASHTDESVTGPRLRPDSGHTRGRVVHWSAPSPCFRTCARTSRPLVRAFARIPAVRADGSSTGPRPRPVSGHARGLVERAHPTHRSPRQHLGRGRTSGAGRVAQSEFRGMRGAQARREGGAVRAPAGREFAALPRRSDERPSRE